MSKGVGKTLYFPLTHAPECVRFRG